MVQCPRCDYSPVLSETWRWSGIIWHRDRPCPSCGTLLRWSLRDTIFHAAVGLVLLFLLVARIYLFSPTWLLILSQPLQSACKF